MTRVNKRCVRRRSCRAFDCNNGEKTRLSGFARWLRVFIAVHLVFNVLFLHGDAQRNLLLHEQITKTGSSTLAR